MMHLIFGFQISSYNIFCYLHENFFVDSGESDVKQRNDNGHIKQQRIAKMIFPNASFLGIIDYFTAHTDFSVNTKRCEKEKNETPNNES